MSWLLRDGDVLAAVEDRDRGWPKRLQGAVVLASPVLVQTFTTRASLDVAWCRAVSGPDATCLEVRRIAILRPYRLVRPRLNAPCLVVAADGCFDRWRLQVGDRLEIKGA